MRKSLLALLFFVFQAAAYAQWLDYKTPGLPRTKDGKPDLSAPAPIGVNGKPSLEGSDPESKGGRRTELAGLAARRYADPISTCRRGLV